MVATGHLQYFDLDGSSSSCMPRGDIKLMGCSVALVSRSDVAGQPWCFRVMTGLTTLVMQATGEEEMLSWAVTLYRAVAMANGGGYLLVKERMRLAGQAPDELAATISPALQQDKGGDLPPSDVSVAGSDRFRAVPSPPLPPLCQDTLELSLPPLPPSLQEQEQGSQVHSPAKAEQGLASEQDGGPMQAATDADAEQGGQGAEQQDDEEAPRQSPTPRKLPAGVTPDGLLAKIAESETVVGHLLTDEQIEGCFRSLNASSGGGDTVRPGHFSQFIRLVTGKQNLYFEMDTFHKWFDQDGDGFVDLSAFKHGVRCLEDREPQHCVLLGLKAFVADSLVPL